MAEHKSKIVADGAQRLREAKDYPAVKRRITLEVRKRYSDVTQKASYWRRLWLEVKIKREVHAELNREFPPAALHISPTSK